MAQRDKTHKSLIDRHTYSYLRRIKRWMYCPACQEGKMTIDQESTMWECACCGYKLSAIEFEDDYVFWFCDECETYLNNQDSFDRTAANHICQKCGFVNSLNDDNIKAVCSDCGKTLSDSGAKLCDNCKAIRTKKWINRGLKFLGGVSLVVGALLAAAKHEEEDKCLFGMAKDFICPRCGNTWSMVPDEYGLFNGYGCPPCPICGENGRDPYDYRDYTCDLCGHEWRVYGNGGLVLGRVPNCPKCGY